MNPRDVSYHLWTMLIAIAFLYNALSISLLVFSEFIAAFYWLWVLLNFVTDFLNLADIVMQTRREYFVDGILIRNAKLTQKRYILRVSEFIALTEHNCPWPLSFRLFRLGIICYLLFHWNACLYFFASNFYGYENSTSDSWTFSHQKIPDLVFAKCDTRFDVYRNECLMPETDWRQRDYQIDQLREHWATRSGPTAFGNLTKKYAMSFYWSALTLVTLGEQPWPENSVQSVFEIVDTLIGLLVFSAIIGDVGLMVSRAHSAKARFQEYIDGCKLYMHIRHVNQQMHDRVIKWVEYQCMSNDRGQTVDENELLNSLPPRLARELAAEFHLNALSRSPVFGFCERGLLSELSLRLQRHRFGPGDIVCGKDEVAKEMFVVKHGKLELVLDDYDEELAERHFISPRLLLEQESGARYPYTLRSVGFSTVYTLSRDAVSVVFADYPRARKMVLRRATQMHQRHERKLSKISAESTAFLRRRNSECLSPFREAEDSDQAATSMEEKVEEMRRAIWTICADVERMESNFVQNSMSMKQHMTSLERKYAEKKPKLKARLRRSMKKT
ncbi:hypothetical protein niasHS_004965 [Heterodera schachtii]|uniref:Cyclic nucleotide-binding domain-containing protein n=1 Tax=Heterodera schachtii TaxID=97005 RepID=A0ABD2JQR4_HETSC